MEKFITLLLLFSFSHLQAQEPGLKNVVGGEINILSLKGATENNDQIDISGQQDQQTRILSLQPYMGWKITNHALLGLRLGYQHRHVATPTFTNTGDPTVNKEDHTDLSVALFSRYYLRPAAKFGLYFEPALAYTYSIGKGVYNGGSITWRMKSQEVTGRVSPGIAYHVTEHLGLLLRFGQVGYSFGKEAYENEADRKYDRFLFNFNLTSFAWGIEYRWGGKRSEPKS